MPKTVDEYVAALPDWQSSLAKDLIETVIQTAPALILSIKWGQPVFESNGPVCYLKGYSNHLTFGFWRGTALMEIYDRLDTSGEKMAHMKLTEGAKLAKPKIKKLVKAAVELNRTLGNPTSTRKSTDDTKGRNSKS